jgi:OmpA-OmpF porin, OOP family
LLKRIQVLVLTFLALLFASAHAAKDPADTPGTSEHPEIKRFPGFHIDASKRNDYNEFVFAVKGLVDGTEDPVGGGEVKGGKYWQTVYCINEGARLPSHIELVRNHEGAFKQVGGTMLVRYPKSGDPELAVFRVPRAGGGDRWVQLSVYNEGGCYRLDIVDVAEMAQKLEFSAGEMADALKKNGFVALNGILFDTGAHTIKPESNALLNEVVAMLKKDKSLKLSIEGHTDNVGAKAANLDLSRRRAESVVKYLTSNGIEAQRLKFEGKGDTTPVADNRAEAGRAKNRRVELVKF